MENKINFNYFTDDYIEFINNSKDYFDKEIIEIENNINDYTMFFQNIKTLLNSKIEELNKK
jgi:hypothetical protein